MREKIAVAFIFAYITNFALCDKSEIVQNLYEETLLRKNSSSEVQEESSEVQEESQMVFPVQGVDTSFMVTNQKTLYENDKHRVDGTIFTHRRMMVGPDLAAEHMQTNGGQVNYMHKPTDVLLTVRTQRTDNNPIQIGLDGKMNLYTSPLGMVGIDGNVGYNRLIGVPSHLANRAWEAGLDVNLINTVFLRGAITLRL